MPAGVLKMILEMCETNVSERKPFGLEVNGRRRYFIAETTETNPNGHRVVELATAASTPHFLVFEDDRVVEEFKEAIKGLAESGTHFYVALRRDLPYQIVRIERDEK